MEKEKIFEVISRVPPEEQPEELEESMSPEERFIPVPSSDEVVKALSGARIALNDAFEKLQAFCRAMIDQCPF